MTKNKISWLRSKKEKQQMTDEELASYIGKQLEHLMMIRECAIRLMARDQLGRDFFTQGETEFVSFVTKEDETKDLIAAYDRVINKPKITVSKKKLKRKRTKVGHEDLPLFQKR